MAQTDYTIANSSGAVFRSRVNELAAAIKSGNSGPTEPPNPVAGMEWFDTSVTPAIMRKRNDANDGWNIVLSGADIAAMRAQLEIAALSGRNLIINGSGRINQRGYTSGTATTSANQFTLDRWFVITSGQNLTFTGNNSRRVMTAPAGGVAQVIEGKNITGGTYVLNWDGTATATVNGTARTKGEAFTLPANTNATVAFFGGTYTDVQLERDVVTPFEQVDESQELLRCADYCVTGNTGLWQDDTTAADRSRRVGIFFTHKMRATPVIALSGGAVANAKGRVAESPRRDGFTFRYESAGSGGFNASSDFIADAEITS